MTGKRPQMKETTQNNFFRTSQNQKYDNRSKNKQDLFSLNFLYLNFNVFKFGF